jgi:FkbM family methyltransferase
MDANSWVRHLRPFWLQDKLYWRLFDKTASERPWLFENAQLRFAPSVKLKLQPTDTSHKRIAVLGFVELELTKQISALAQDGGVMLDIGANYGYFTCLWAAARSSNQVVAFEAAPKNFDALQHNVERNRLGAQVSLVQKAVGKESGKMSFSLGQSDQTSWGGLSLEQKKDSVEVNVITLDDFFAEKQAPPIQVLKIDTEGADTWVLRGAERLLRSGKIRHIFFEVNLPRMAELGIDPNEAPELLQRFGYEVKHIGKGECHASLI